MAEVAQKLRRISHQHPDAPKINWLVAKEVPIEVIQRENSGKQVEGTIVTGPGGQTTYLGPIKGISKDVGERDSYSHSA